MTGKTVATITWRALHCEGQDTCRLARADHGWLLVGHARFHDDDGFAALDYVVRCTEDWQTLDADIAGTHGESEVRLHIDHRNGEWLLNETPQPGLEDATDIDLSFTPATNLMPLRRLAKQQDDTLTTRAAWLYYPAATLAPLDQTYQRTHTYGIMEYRAEQTDYSTTLEVNDAGFVTDYPDLWHAEDQHVPL
ncbi:MULTISPECIES: putative glycolipid-binding domain-containing protein [Roseovarius]|uniref:putative glycolipid-binding domain-containing protein n=1 Tax=Roseovarius TaxID=74030 RepID=UPI00273E31D7|nr:MULTISPECIES: putative glycolipid-binding domain-containing protein [unclassified Roseovarius]